MSCSCNVVDSAAAAPEEILDVADAALSSRQPPPPLSSARTCEEFSELNRARLLFRGTPRPALRPRDRRFTYRKPDPCNEVVDPQTEALLAQLNQNNDPVDGFRPCKRVCRTPSIFRANNEREAIEQCFEAGFFDQLPDAGVGFGGRGRCGASFAGAGNEKRFAQLTAKSRNLLQRPFSFCRKSSVFTCDNDRCQASLCVEIGATDTLPDQQQRNYNAGCTAGLGGGRGPGDKTFGDLCVRVTRYGNSA